MKTLQTPHSLPSIFSRLDGTGRSPRPQQIDALNFVIDTSEPVKVLIMPVGTGKSFVKKTLQNSQFKAWGITCNNVLVDQYAEDYPSDNILKGKKHYECTQLPNLSCEDRYDIFKESDEKYCPNCPYKSCVDRALLGEPTVFNPMSLYALRGADEARPSMTVGDEAHQIPGMLRLLSSAVFSSDKYPLPTDIENYDTVLKWLKDNLNGIKDLTKLAQKSGDLDKQAELKEEADKFRHVLHGFSESQANYAVYIEQKKSGPALVMTPIKVVPSVAKRVLGSGEIVLMSGTLFYYDIQELVGNRKYTIFECGSPIPVENRRIYYEPTTYPINYKTDPALIAKTITEIIERNKGLNTIIHVSYALSQRLQPYLHFPFICNTSVDKMEKLAEFKKNGGIFLASGLAEGIDLKDDLARITIIPQLLWPNLSDPVVKKRMALEDGQDWYTLETLKTTIQQAGRSTRHEKDWSRIYIMDPRFGGAVTRVRRHLPRYFLDSIVWRKK